MSDSSMHPRQPDSGSQITSSSCASKPHDSGAQWHEKLPVSVHILTWNSGKTLRAALESVKQCSEIIVIDGGSTDDTVSIAKEFGANVIPQNDDGASKPIDDFAAVRNRGLKASTESWIMALDSDETASPELMEDVKRISATDNPIACFVPRRYVLDDGTVVRHATTYPNERIYFFHRDAVDVWIKSVHERVQLKDGVKTKHLKGYSLAPLGTVADYIRKNLQYLQIEAESSKKIGWGHWLIHKVLRTIRSRIIALVRLTLIWVIPRRGKRLPLRQELIRFWYGWKLIVMTCPLRK